MATSDKQADKKNKKGRSEKAQIEKPKKTVKNIQKKNTSLRLENTVLKQLKIRAIEEDTSVQSLLENLVLDYLNKPK